MTALCNMMQKLYKSFCSSSGTTYPNPPSHSHSLPNIQTLWMPHPQSLRTLNWMSEAPKGKLCCGREEIGQSFKLFWGSGVSPSNILMVRKNQGSWIKRQVECWSLHLNAILKWVVYIGDYHTFQTFFSRILIIMCRRYWGCCMSMVPWSIVYLIKTWI